MKKLIVLVLVAVMAVCCAMPCHALENPWAETDGSGMRAQLGYGLRAPEAAMDVVYRVHEAEGLGEVQFTWRGVEYAMRVKASDGFEDVSGLHYGVWDVVESCTVRYCDGTFCSVTDGGAVVESCVWYDAAPGLTYSLNAVVTEGFEADTAALANVLFEIVQGDAGNVEVAGIDALGLLNVMEACCGLEGTAGGSLKQALAAENMLNYAIESEAAICAAEYIADEYALAAALMDEEMMNEVAVVCALVDAAFADYEAVKGLFDDAGAENMAALIEADSAAAHWAKLSAVFGG